MVLLLLALLQLIVVEPSTQHEAPVSLQEWGTSQPLDEELSHAAQISFGESGALSSQNQSQRQRGESAA